MDQTTPQVDILEDVLRLYPLYHLRHTASCLSCSGIGSRKVIAGLFYTRLAEI